MNAFLLAAAATITGTACAALAACFPGLHIYNVLGVLLWFVYNRPDAGPLSPFVLIPGVFAMITAWSITNSIPSILLAAPDESALHTVLPGQKMLREGKGRQAVCLTALGSVCGVGVLLLSAPTLPHILPLVYTVTRPHLHWILWAIILFMLLSEWPKALPPGLRPFQRLRFAWKAGSVGILVFLLSGLFGFILLFRSPLPVGNAFLNLMPAFVGLFTMPQLLLHCLCANPLPPQEQGPAFPHIPPRALTHGTLAGVLGGAFAAFFPVLTGGIGGMLAGHATALRSNKGFLISQGASKTIYYIGGILLLVMPGMHLTRGGGAWLMQGVQPQPGPYDYHLALGAIALAAALSTLCLDLLARQVLRLAKRIGYQRLSLLSAVLVMSVIACFGGIAGLAVLTVGCGIGLLPILYGSRRMNALGIILLPLACSISGFAPSITRILFPF